MRLSNRMTCLIAFSLATACLNARAGDWVPARDRGAYIENLQYGMEPYDDWGNSALTLRVTLQDAGEFVLSPAPYGTPDVINAFYQSLLQAKADSLPVMLLADGETRTFNRILIGTVDPRFPVAARGLPAAERNGRETAARIGFDPLGRTLPAASARVPFLARPAPAR
jgi:hypothetical protein